MLSPDQLSESLRPLFTPGTMPVGSPIDVWARAYVGYAQDATAGPALLTSPLVLPPASGDFLSGLDEVLRGTWMSAIWAGPGVTGVTSIVPGLAPFFMESSGILVGSLDRELALTAIVKSIHTYTLSITVVLTSATGVATVTLA